jgi:hypothetical protein
MAQRGEPTTRGENLQRAPQVVGRVYGPSDGGGCSEGNYVFASIGDAWNKLGDNPEVTSYLKGRDFYAPVLRLPAGCNYCEQFVVYIVVPSYRGEGRDGKVKGEMVKRIWGRSRAL